MDFIVEKEEGVYPMVPAGADLFVLLGGAAVLLSLWVLREPSYPQNVGVVGEEHPNR